MTTKPVSKAGAEAAGRKNSWLYWLAGVGPGVVYILTVIGTGDFVSNAAAGAGYAYALIWALGLTLVFRFVWVNTSAKYVLVTGESLIAGYARLGNWVLWIIMISGIVLRHFYNLYKIQMMGVSLDLLFHLPTPYSSIIWSLVFTVIGFVMIIWGGYNVIEIVFKIIVAAMGISLVVAAALSHPDPVGILKGALIPSIPGNEGLYSAIFVLMALIGTEAGSMTNLTYPYFLYEKGWRDKSYLKQQRFDLAFGVVGIFVMGALVQIAAAGTVRPLGIKLEGPEHLVKIFEQTQGMLGLVIFVLGMWGSSFSTYVGATAGYGYIFVDVVRNHLPTFRKSMEPSNKKRAIEADPLYRWFIAISCFSPVYILFTNVKPVWLILTVSSVVVVLIPVLAFALLILTNNKKLMGEYKNNVFTNTVMLLLIAVSIYFTYTSAKDLIHQLAKYF